MIKVTSLSKRYRLGEQNGYDSLRETIIKTIKSPIRILKSRNCGGDRESHRESHVWALHDVNFEIKHGDVVGIIGRNGCGKSTLLKVLSRITRPTAGRVELYGRVGSLLEVGTGFHPELTGRENVFLNGAILGMKRGEIAKKFDEIVDFSGIEKFLDTPVKRYSSGMYVRLAFAVAAHLESEILLVDEVLAVGDGEFQKKCLGKIDQVARGGRTVLFVSHNMAVVEALCKSAIFLDSGGIRMIGDARDIVSGYAKFITDTGSMFADLRHHSGRSRDAKCIMTEVSIASQGAEPSVIRTGDSMAIVVKFNAPMAIRPCCGFTIKTEWGTRISHISDSCSNQLSTVTATDAGIVTCYLSDLPLLRGRYSIDLWLSDFSSPTTLDTVGDACWFEVFPADMFGSGRLPPPSEGPVFLRGKWSFLPTSSDVSFTPTKVVSSAATHKSDS